MRHQLNERTALVYGGFDSRFQKVVKIFGDKLQTGEELGASLAVDIGGEMILDIWGGYADAARIKQWQADTIVNVWSSTKTVTSLAALVLVDRGVLNVRGGNLDRHRVTTRTRWVI